MTVELRTRYLGLDLRSPLVASPSPLTRDLESVRALVDAGAAAIVLPSLFRRRCCTRTFTKGAYQPSVSDWVPFPSSASRHRLY